MQDSLLYLLTATLFFGIGTIFSVPNNVHQHEEGIRSSFMSPDLVSFETNSLESGLQEQWHAQKQFQAWIRQQEERPSDCSRVLRYIINKEEEQKSWIECLEGLTRALKVAMATERRLVISLDDDSSMCSGSTSKHVYCRWRGRHDVCQQVATTTATSIISPVREGILPNVDSSDFFHVRLYGPTPVVDLPTWPLKKSWLLDALDWERYWGAFWVRSQLLHYLLGQELAASYAQNDNGSRHNNNSIEVAIVLDMNGQSAVTERFGRNATRSHDWSRLLTIVNHLKNTSVIQGSSSTMYIVTIPPSTTQSLPPPSLLGDDWNVAQPTEDPQDDQKVLSVLQQANFLVGSFASPYFRLATALNTAHHIGTYPLSKRRHWGVDIEWFEDP